MNCACLYTLFFLLLVRSEIDIPCNPCNPRSSVRNRHYVGVLVTICGPYLPTVSMQHIIVDWFSLLHSRTVPFTVYDLRG